MINEFVKVTNQALVEKYGLTMGLRELSEVLHMTLRKTKQRLDNFNINYQHEGRDYIIPTIEVASYIHQPKVRLEKEKKNFIF